MRLATAEVLGIIFSNLPAKYQAWMDLIHLVKDKEPDVRFAAVRSLSLTFSYLPEKDKGWVDLHQLAQDSSLEVRLASAEILKSAFLDLPEKSRAWEDLICLAHDEDRFARRIAARACSSVFSGLSDKYRGWKDLICLLHDEDEVVRTIASDALGSAFYELTEKDKAWEDLHLLAQDNDFKARKAVAEALGSAFSDLSEKDRAWEDLHLLVQDDDFRVRQVVAEALGSAFSDLPEKDQAWKDLHNLTQDGDYRVRQAAAEALGSAFSDLPEKDEAWEDLHRLAQDDGSVITTANNSLGRASINRAIEAKDEDAFRKEIESAIGFFEKSLLRSRFTPSIFCLPFYRSFYAITFKKTEALAEVEQYLQEARDAAHGQKNKEILIEAIENLSRALLEVKRLDDSDLDLIKLNLKAYKQYCDRAGELLTMMEKDAPGAVRVMRRGMPIIDRRIKTVLKDVEEKAANFCRSAKDTPLQNQGRRAFEGAAGLGGVELQDEADRTLRALMIQAKGYCDMLPQEIKELVCGQLKCAEKAGSMEKGIAISSAFSAMATYALVMKDSSDEKQKFINFHIGQITAKLKEIDFNIMKHGLLSSSIATNSSEMVNQIKKIEGQLKELASLRPELELLQGSVDTLSQSMQKNLQERDKEMDEIAKYLEKIIKDMPDKGYLLNELDKLKERGFWKVANRASALASIISLL